MSVKLRKKTLADGKTSLYLDVYQDGKRQYEFLKLYLEKAGNNSIVRNKNKETLALAEKIKTNRELEMQASEHGFVPSFKRRSNFLDYFERLVPRHSGNIG